MKFRLPFLKNKPKSLDQVTADQQPLQSALNEKNDPFQALFNASFDPILLLNQDRFTDANLAALSSLGLNSKQDLYKLSPSDISPIKQEDGQDSASKFQQMTVLAEQQGFHRFEWQHAHSDGSISPVEISLSPISINGEKILHLVWRDISERKLSENARKKYQERLENKIENNSTQISIAENKTHEEKNKFEVLFEKSNYAMALIENNKFIECNRQAIQIMGLKSKADLLSKNPSELSPKFQADGQLSLDKANNYMGKSLKKGSTRFEWQHMRQDDYSLYWANVSLTSLEFQGKQLIYATWRDISQFKELEAKQQSLLQETLSQEEYYRSLLANLDIGLALNTVQGDFVYLNTALAHIIGYTVDEVKALSYWQLTPKIYAESEQAQLISLQKSNHYGPYEKEYIHKDGRLIPVRLQGSFIEKEGEKFILSSVENITDSKQQRLNLQQAKEEAEKANTAKSAFLSSMSHELRTPLNAILGFGQLLQSDTEAPLTDDQQDNLHYIVDSGQHLLALINQVLELSSIESGKTELHLEYISLNNIVDDTIASLLPIAQESHIKINVLSNEMLNINCDYTKLKQILINLISNAIKYNHESGQVTINWELVNNTTVRINIRDSGKGISTSNQAHVFTAFNRLGQENSNIEGTGIGLLVTKELVELLEGRISFESIEHQGSNFWFELPYAELIPPIKQTNLPQEPESDNELAKNITELKNILYVEDNFANRKLMQSFFSKQKNYHLQMAETGELGWEITEKNKFDLILMDMNLPGISGKELTQKLKASEKYKHTPIIAMTAAAMTEDIDSYKDLFDAYITKPVNLTALLNTLKTTLNTQ